MTTEVRYIVHQGSTELVDERTARRHRVLTVDEDGDVTIANDAGTAIAMLSRAEVALLVSTALRAHAARFLRRR